MVSLFPENHNFELQALTGPWLLEHMLPVAHHRRLCLPFSHPTQGSLLQGMSFSFHLTSTHSQNEDAMKLGGPVGRGSPASLQLITVEAQTLLAQEIIRSRLSQPSDPGAPSTGTYGVLFP